MKLEKHLPTIGLGDDHLVNPVWQTTMGSILKAFRSFTNCSLLKSQNNLNNLSPHQLAEIRRSIDSLISDNQILIFGKSYCPYCERAKKFLSDKLNATKKDEQLKIKSLELDLDPNGAIIQQELTKKLNKDKITVPQIFIRSHHIGGCDDMLTREKQGELDKLF